MGTLVGTYCNLLTYWLDGFMEVRIMSRAQFVFTNRVNQNVENIMEAI